jgi:uncharacterized protein (TIGR04255 family)
MDFDPVNQDHAIFAVTFSATLDHVLDEGNLSAIRREHRVWRAELPAMSPVQAVMMRVNPATRAQETINAMGVQFARLRPDGSPAWLLRAVGQEVVVECFLYTRWERVWERARYYIIRVIKLLCESQIELKIPAVSLTVQDRFRVTRQPYDLSTLLVHNDVLPRHVFERGSFWHSHSGWFQPENMGQVLNVVNIESRDGFTSPSGGDDEANALFVVFMHLQQYRPTEAISGNRTEFESVLNELLEKMHQSNKRLMHTMLTPDMRKRIGLDE